MKKRLKITLAIFSFCFLCVAIIIIGYFTNVIFPWERTKSIQEAIDMGGLSELPIDAENIEIEKRGSMFTRQYIIEFNCTEAEIEKWIDKSKRLKNNIPKIEGKTKIYEIYPGENGAMGGKVKIEKSKVSVNMSWS
ncbi:hypothetical protein ACFPVY_15805 [Flavobacterium qiangtangense]|uniref:DUF4230 domain-containing protein n=1 Tax=Flavobacterium qiangtangense TaxID=1442595 RepID=A0ABW1PTK2_9FLAO